MYITYRQHTGLMCMLLYGPILIFNSCSGVAFSPFPYHHMYLQISKSVHHCNPLAYLFAKGLQLPADILIQLKYLTYKFGMLNVL